jgi:hypothetical protein
VLQATLLGVEVLVAAERRLEVLLHQRNGLLGFSPLNGPLHNLVSDQHGDSPVQNLVLCSAVRVENSGVSGTGKGTLAVLGQTVGDDATLRRGAYRGEIWSVFGLSGRACGCRCRCEDEYEGSRG